jgi:predicted enzyme related to lactoylglutathione lyase
MRDYPHGTPSWVDLTSPDVDAAVAFYGAVFGWEPTDVPWGNGLTYTVFNLGDRWVAGLMRMTDEWPADMPPHWMTYFAVDNADATARRAGELGGKVPVPPSDIPGVGRFAVLSDPHGVVFSVVKNAPQPR